MKNCIDALETSEIGAFVATESLLEKIADNAVINDPLNNWSCLFPTKYYNSIGDDYC